VNARRVVPRETLLAFCALALACEPSAPVRDCTGCIYSFADTVPPNTRLVFHWPAARLPVRFYADPRGAMPTLVALGVASWQGQFLYGEFSGTVVSDSSHADVIVTWLSGVPADVPPDAGPAQDACAGATTDPTAVFRDSSANVLHVALTPKAGFTDGQVAACLRRVVIHELGHALGLLRESTFPDDMMNETPTVTAPSVRDRRTIEVLYHTGPTVAPPPR
jgi:predicted Zn-dependent protease